ncbi:hypothetical protein VNO77_30883 [Canavalia gladiata]|uniref:Secreted protein n=1 Tax=Canavalia gladiata TaxID=3824 RepID=A0AAN9KPW2_CANGL
MFNVKLLEILIRSVAVPCTLTKPCISLWFDSKSGATLAKPCRLTQLLMEPRAAAEAIEPSNPQAARQAVSHHTSH